MPEFQAYPPADALADGNIALVLQGSSTRRFTLAELKNFVLAAGAYRGAWVGTNSYVVGDLVGDPSAGGLWRCIATDNYLGESFPTYNPAINDHWVSAEIAPRYLIQDVSGDTFFTINRLWCGDRSYNRCYNVADDDMFLYIPNYDPAEYADANFPIGSVIQIKNALAGGSVTVTEAAEEGLAEFNGNPVLAPGEKVELVYLGDNKWDINR